MTILVPTDFSETAINALTYAIEIAKAKNATILLLHAMDSPAGKLEQPVCEARLNELAEIAKRSPVKVKTRCIKGPAEDVICDCTEKEKLSLIIMGSTGESTFEKTLLGSTATNVIEKAACPVLTVPSGAMFTSLQKITFATEYKTKDLEAIKALIELVKPLQFRLTFLHVFKEDQPESER
jgi:nucleotide-binding universal stress UspA family protein